MRFADRNYNLATYAPELIDEWNDEKNEGIHPEDMFPKSSKKVWWKCSKGHEWCALINNRVRGEKCPYCTGRLPIKGYNDLETLYPEVAKEWNYDKNGDLKPSDVLPKSNKKVWWRCSEGHEWSTKISVRTKGSECPYCKGKKPIKGKTDLATVNPQLASEWSPRNIKKPNEYTVNSGEVVWWRCSKGHEWPNSIHSRNSNNTGCPYCSNQKAIKGDNDFATVHPELLDEWNYEKNKDKLPEDYMPGSHAIVWWRCGKGHEWPAHIYSRHRGHGCPYCAGQLPVKGENDFATLKPELASEWSSKNSKGPDEYTISSGQKVLWECGKGHIWEARIADRVKGRVCPYCSGRKLMPHVNDLETLYPEIAAEWHPTKNGDLKPSDVTKSSGKKIIWKCLKAGHEWPATVANRVHGTKCPYCSGRMNKKDPSQSLPAEDRSRDELLDS